MSALSTSVVAAIRDLELAARLVVEGLRAGGHRSPLHGYSAEFQQHRPYRAGDDLKYLDWKVLARTDRLYTRQFRETTSMSVIIVLDASASMAFPETEPSKFRYASIMAAALAYLIAVQGDAVGFMSMAADRLVYMPPRGGRPHLRALLHRIDQLRPAGRWQPARVVARAAELLRRRGLVIVLSDLYDAEDETRRTMRRVLRLGHDLAVLHVLSAAELSFPFHGALEFKDLESGQARLLNAEGVATAYHSGLQDFLAGWRAAAVRDGIDYALLSTAMPPEQALRNFLVRRSAQPGARRVSGVS